jgi:hypothetical protein
MALLGKLMGSIAGIRFWGNEATLISPKVAIAGVSYCPFR